MMSDAIWPDERAGWWRRTLALLVDGLLVCVPSVALGTFMFGVTGGLIQWSQPGLQWQVCAPVTAIPADLEPPPPANSNEAAVCRVQSLFGPIGLTMTVGRTTHDGGTTSTLSRSYALRVSGERGAYDVSWITYAALLALLIGAEWRYGTTPGKRLLGLRVVAADDPARRSVPFRRIVTRYAVAFAGVALPLGIALAIILVPVMTGGTPAGSMMPVAAILLVVASAWQVWNLVRIVRRRTAIYDHVARVEVVRARSLAEPAPMRPGPASP